jgi:hypothetical protein
MELRMRRQKIDQMRLYANSFIAGKDTLLNYNQVKGRNMVGYFQGNKLKKVDVLGNAESLYFALEGDTSLTGMNKAVSSNMALRFGTDSKLQTISFLTNPDASFIPPHELKDEDKQLKGFQWREKERPTRRGTLGKHFALPVKAKPKTKAKRKATTTKTRAATKAKARPAAAPKKPIPAPAKPAQKVTTPQPKPSTVVPAPRKPLARPVDILRRKPLK